MSEAIMRKKAATLYVSHSGKDGFSLNGKTRFKGPGQVSLAESVTKTRFRGNEPMGHGGGSCSRGGDRRKSGCGKYPLVISNSGSAWTPQVLVKQSSANMAAMIEQRHMGIFHGTYPNTWVKDMTDANVVKKAAATHVLCPPLTNQAENICGPYAKNVLRASHSEHTRQISAQCVKPSCSQRPFPFRYSGGGCGRTFLTWQDAKAAGALCSDFNG
jgi:hypothetical protein